MMPSTMTFVCQWPANLTLDRTAGSHTLAAAGQRRRWAAQAKAAISRANGDHDLAGVLAPGDQLPIPFAQSHFGPRPVPGEPLAVAG